VTLAWISGASRGIGRATAIRLAQRRTDLLLLGRASTRLDELKAQLSAIGAIFHVAEVDLSNAAQLTAVCREQLQHNGVPDIVINNAGVITRQPVEQITLDSWNQQFDVNLRAPFVLTREVLPSMRTRGNGRLIYMASISATLGTPRAAAYCASKWAVVGFMKSLAEELSNSGLMALAILPGSVDTDMLSGSGFEARMSPDDVARTVAFYALDAGLGHNGSIIEMFGV
jgi:3-oxoacyl-[acyl-carrier protein] reductase